MRTILDRCDLLTESGSLTESDMDRRIDFHFNALLDNVAEWRKNRDMAQDTDLLSRINDMHKQFLEESQLTFTQVGMADTKRRSYWMQGWSQLFPRGLEIWMGSSFCSAKS